MYIRILKITFTNEFIKNSILSYAGPKADKLGFNSGLILKFTTEISENQIMIVHIWPDKKTAEKAWIEFAKDISNKIKSTGAKFERIEGPLIGNLKLNNSFQFEKFKFNI